MLPMLKWILCFLQEIAEKEQDLEKVKQRLHELSEMENNMGKNFEAMKASKAAGDATVNTEIS